MIRFGDFSSRSRNFPFLPAGIRPIRRTKALPWPPMTATRSNISNIPSSNARTHWSVRSPLSRRRFRSPIRARPENSGSFRMPLRTSLVESGSLAAKALTKDMGPPSGASHALRLPNRACPGRSPARGGVVDTQDTRRFGGQTGVLREDPVGPACPSFRGLHRAFSGMTSSVPSFRARSEKTGRSLLQAGRQWRSEGRRRRGKRRSRPVFPP